jgi:cation transport ATPase
MNVYNMRVAICVYSAEKASEHPLARAIVAYAEDSNITGNSSTTTTDSSTADSTVVSQQQQQQQQQFLSIQDGTFKAVSGKGLSCIIDGHTVAVGSPSFVEQHVVAYRTDSAYTTR